MDTRSIAARAPPGVGWDGVGVFWAVISIVWTLLLLAGMAFLYERRDMPHLRIRSLPLCFAAVIMLHTYWLCDTLAYIYAELMPKAIEFWVMSIWFPFGIALFQASNSEFLHVSRAQKKFARDGSVDTFRSEKGRREIGRQSFLARFRQLDYPRRTLIYISMGMTVQVRAPPAPLQRLEPID